MSQNFDEIIDRSGTNSVKWDAREQLFGSATALPMWVADMDFKNSDQIRKALHELIDDQILGYALPSDSLFESIILWQKERHQMNINKENILFSPGVVGAIAVCVQALTSPHDGVLIHDPVYTPFSSVVQSNNRRIYRTPLIIENGQYKMDYDHIEKSFKEHSIKMFILSNPHNPGGRVWTKKELIQLIDLCIQYEVILISDEIHSDLTYTDSTIYSPISLKEEYKNWVVTLHSASKTFNLAGVKLAFYIVCNDELKGKIETVQHETEQNSISTFGMVATEAAFSKSIEWHKELMEYLEENRNLVIEFFDKELPEVFYMKPESTYLFWFDASSLHIEGDKLTETFIQKGDIALNAGIAYGNSSQQFMRLNFACPRSVLEEGLLRVKKVFDSVKN